MKYNRLGRTGLYVSEICLGTMTWGGKGFWEVIGKLGLEAITGQLRTAFDAGVNFIDTANVYHEGESEKLLAQGLAKLGTQRDKIIIATKVFGRTSPDVNHAGLSRKNIFDQVDASLSRLNLDYIDLYQTHGNDRLTPLEETVDALDDLVRSGKVRYVGFCNMPAWRAQKAIDIADRAGKARFVSAQMFYAIAARDIEREIVPMAQAEGLGILPWSPLAGGLLSGKFTADGGPKDARRAQFDFPIVDKPRAMACVDAMRPIASEHGVSVAQIALGYIMQKPGVASVIIGAKTDEQLVDNLATCQLTLSATELAVLDKVSALPPEYPGWMDEFQGRTRTIDGQTTK
jgi:aryl-alcohol dehydrogenase-like predicted oxidoreductase